MEQSHIVLSGTDGMKYTAKERGLSNSGMAMDSERVLSQEQLDFLAAHQDVLDALWELADSEEFKAVFGEMALGELFSRYEASLGDDDEHDPELARRYEQIKRREANEGVIVDWDNDLDALESKYRP